jgi:hypothetical protein
MDSLMTAGASGTGSTNVTVAVLFVARISEAVHRPQSPRLSPASTMFTVFTAVVASLFVNVRKLRRAERLPGETHVLARHRGKAAELCGNFSTAGFDAYSGIQSIEAFSPMSTFSGNRNKVNVEYGQGAAQQRAQRRETTLELRHVHHPFLDCVSDFNNEPLHCAFVRRKASLGNFDLGTLPSE